MGVNKYMDHHALFNLVIYFLLLIYAYYRRSANEQSRGQKKSFALQGPNPVALNK